MSRKSRHIVGRRVFLCGAASAMAGLAAPAIAQNADASVDTGGETSRAVRRNISGFRPLDWSQYFDDTVNGAILADTKSRTLHFWSEDLAIYKLYPTSVPSTEDLTRRGRTKVVRKVEGPSWRPTPEMLKRNPEWPEFVAPGPDNPMGTHALYLSWRYYRIHGTHDTRKIGRRASSGCIGLYNEHIAELFSMTKVGTQVVLV